MDVPLYQKIKVILLNDFPPPPSLIDDAFGKKNHIYHITSQNGTFFRIFYAHSESSQLPNFQRIA